MELHFRIKSDIFSDWIYSESHYKLSYFFDRWEEQYFNEPEFNPVMEQFINGEWIEVTP